MLPIRAIHQLKYLLLFSALLFTGAATSAQEEKTGVPTAERSVAIQIEATIVEIDHDSRELTLEGPGGNLFSMMASDDIERLAEFDAGDTVVASYIAAFAAELREPTEEELAEPWVELDGAERASLEELPSAAGVQIIRAVCTIEGINRLLGTVVLRDPRDDYHTVADVDRQIMPDLRIGNTVVVTFSQALALDLMKPTQPSS